MEYLGRFNQLSQYASEYVSIDIEKKHCFVRGLHTKLQVMLVGHINASYNEIVSIAISSEYKYHQHKEAKNRKEMLEESSSDSAQHQRIVYQPIHHSLYYPPQQQAQQQVTIRPTVALTYPDQPNTLSVCSKTHKVIG